MSEVWLHPTAIVSPSATLGSCVRLGPYAVVEGPAVLEEGVVVGPHAVVGPYVRLAKGVEVHAHAVLGGRPQDLGFQEQQTWVEVEAGAVIREGVTVHRSTSADRPTRVGAGSYLMAYAHVAHDCQIGEGVVITNNVMLAGHVQVGDKAVIGGGSAVHQYVRIGKGAMVGGMVGVGQDILPFMMAVSTPARHYRLNAVGLRRIGVSGERYRALEAAWRALREGRGIEDLPETQEIAELRAFLRAPSKRGIARFTTLEHSDTE